MAGKKKLCFVWGVEAVSSGEAPVSLVGAGRSAATPSPGVAWRRWGWKALEAECAPACSPPRMGRCVRAWERSWRAGPGGAVSPGAVPL